MEEVNSKNEMKLWYLEEADTKDWNQALPIGNGNLGGMVFGGIKSEHVQLNEDTVWYGGPRDRNNQDAFKYLPQIRKLLLEGKLKEAERLSLLSQSGTPQGEGHYEPLGDLFIEFQDNINIVKDYRRELDIENAVVTIRYTLGSINYKREIFTSTVQKVMVLRFTTDKPGSISFVANLDRSKNFDENAAIADDTLLLSGTCGGSGGAKFYTLLKSLSEGGKSYSIGSRLIVENADSVTLLLDARTNFYGDDPYKWCLNTLNMLQF